MGGCAALQLLPGGLELSGGQALLPKVGRETAGEAALSGGAQPLRTQQAGSAGTLAAAEAPGKWGQGGHGCGHGSRRRVRTQGRSVCCTVIGSKGDESGWDSLTHSFRGKRKRSFLYFQKG